MKQKKVKIYRTKQFLERFISIIKYHIIVIDKGDDYYEFLYNNKKFLTILSYSKFHLDYMLNIYLIKGDKKAYIGSFSNKWILIKDRILSILKRDYTPIYKYIISDYTEKSAF